METGCGSSPTSTAATAASQPELDAFARDIGVRLEIVDNRPASCPKGANGCFLSHLDLKMPGSLASDLARGDFKLYFSSVSPVIEGGSEDFRALVLKDPDISARLSREEVERVFSLDTYMRNVDAVFARVFSNSEGK